MARPAEASTPAFATRFADFLLDHRVPVSSFYGGFEDWNNATTYVRALSLHNTSIVPQLRTHTSLWHLGALRTACQSMVWWQSQPRS